MDRKVDVLIVLVHFDAPDDMIKVVDDFMRQELHVSFQLVVVDNCSKQCCFEKLKCGIPDGVDVVQTSSNRGFGAGVNYGVKFGQKYSPDFVHVVNPDVTIANPGYLDTLCSALRQNPRYGIIGPAVYKDKDKNNVQNTIMPFPSLYGAFNFRRYYSSVSEVEEEPTLTSVDVINGVCFLIKTNIYLAVGGFSEDYFMYVEEHDLCFKVKEAGYNVGFYSVGSIEHEGGVRGEVLDWRYFFIRKNQVLFLYHRGSFFQGFLLALLFCLSFLVKYIRAQQGSSLPFLRCILGLVLPNKVRTVNELS